MNRERVCLIVRHATMAPLALALVAGVGWTLDRVKGPPQEITTTRALDAAVRPGGWLRVSYSSIKFRDCPIEISRWLHRLDEDGQRLDAPPTPAAAGTLVGTHGLARPGQDTRTVRLWIPPDLPPGAYEYEAEIHRRCIPLVGRRWPVAQPPARFEVLPAD